MGRVITVGPGNATSNMTSSPEAAAETAPPPDQEGGVETGAAAGGPCAKPLALFRFASQFAFQHWFILGLGLFIGLAAAVPKARGTRQGASAPCCFMAPAPLALTLWVLIHAQVAKTGGYIRSEWTFKYGAVRAACGGASKRHLSRLAFLTHSPPSCALS